MRTVLYIVVASLYLLFPPQARHQAARMIESVSGYGDSFEYWKYQPVHNAQVDHSEHWTYQNPIE